MQTARDQIDNREPIVTLYLAGVVIPTAGMNALLQLVPISGRILLADPCSSNVNLTPYSISHIQTTRPIYPYKRLITHDPERRHKHSYAISGFEQLCLVILISLV